MEADEKIQRLSRALDAANKRIDKLVLEVLDYARAFSRLTVRRNVEPMDDGWLFILRRHEPALEGQEPTFVASTSTGGRLVLSEPCSTGEVALLTCWRRVRELPDESVRTMTTGGEGDG